ncbi:MAG TPA: PIG-L family deacetylase [Pseudolabrys sp.]|nr:PIG-L family deacetylase [Pseudolabrys sp.]
MNIAVIVAHPDDEVLGAGGTMARHVKEGHAVHVLIVADGETSRPDRAVDKRAQAAANAARTLGAEPPRLLGLADQRLDTVPLLDVTQAIERFLAEAAPSVVYTHHPNDLNADHCIVARAVMTACRPLPGSAVTAIYGFETPSSTEWAPPDAAETFVPARFVDISDTLSVKMAALKHYDAEMRPFPHPRSYEAIEALARWRGATAGMRAAEAFVVLRDLLR